MKNFDSLLLIISIFILGYVYGIPKPIDTDAIAKVSNQIQVEQQKLHEMKTNKASAIQIEWQKGEISRLENDKRILEGGGSTLN